MTLNANLVTIEAQPHNECVDSQITRYANLCHCRFCNFTFRVPDISFPYSDTVSATKTPKTKPHQDPFNDFSF